jgi:hypothetical protein
VHFSYFLLFFRFLLVCICPLGPFSQYNIMLHSSPARSWKIIFLLLNLNLHYSRARRKRLNVSSDGHDDTSHGRSSDEQTLQVLKSR